MLKFSDELLFGVVSLEEKHAIGGLGSRGQLGTAGSGVVLGGPMETFCPFLGSRFSDKVTSQKVVPSL